MSWGYDPPEVEVLEGTVESALTGFMVELEGGFWVRPDAVLAVRQHPTLSRAASVELLNGTEVKLVGQTAQELLEKLGVITA